MINPKIWENKTCSEPPTRYHGVTIPSVWSGWGPGGTPGWPLWHPGDVEPAMGDRKEGDGAVNGDSGWSCWVYLPCNVCGASSHGQDLQVSPRSYDSHVRMISAGWSLKVAMQMVNISEYLNLVLLSLSSEWVTWPMNYLPGTARMPVRAAWCHSVLVSTGSRDSKDLGYTWISQPSTSGTTATAMGNHQAINNISGHIGTTGFSHIFQARFPPEGARSYQVPGPPPSSRPNWAQRAWRADSWAKLRWIVWPQYATICINMPPSMEKCGASGSICKVTMSHVSLAESTSTLMIPELTKWYSTRWLGLKIAWIFHDITQPLVIIQWLGGCWVQFHCSTNPWMKGPQ